MAPSALITAAEKPRGWGHGHKWVFYRQQITWESISRPRGHSTWAVPLGPGSRSRRGCRARLPDPPLAPAMGRQWLHLEEVLGTARQGYQRGGASWRQQQLNPKVRQKAVGPPTWAGGQLAQVSFPAPGTPRAGLALPRSLVLLSSLHSVLPEPSLSPAMRRPAGVHTASAPPAQCPQCPLFLRSLVPLGSRDRRLLSSKQVSSSLGPAPPLDDPRWGGIRSAHHCRTAPPNATLL